MPVACAKALGGVLIGNIIANDEPIATPINKVSTPPSEDKVLTHTASRNGKNGNEQCGSRRV